MNSCSTFSPLGIEVDASGKVTGVKVVQTLLWVSLMKRVVNRPEPVAGSKRTCAEADAVIMAFGFQPHPMSWLETTRRRTGSLGSEGIKPASEQLT